MEGRLDEIREMHRKNALLIEFERKESLQRFTHEPAFNKLLASSRQEGSQIIIEAADIEQAESELIRGLNETQIMPSRLEILEPSLEGLFMEAIQ